MRHREFAAQAKTTPGAWIRVRAYNSPNTASRMAAFVKEAGPCHLAAYNPVGSFEAETRPEADGTAVWVKYVGPSSKAATA